MSVDFNLAFQVCCVCVCFVVVVVVVCCCCIFAVVVVVDFFLFTISQGLYFADRLKRFCFEGSGPEWCISSMLYSRDIP